MPDGSAHPAFFLYGSVHGKMERDLNRESSSAAATVDR